MKPETITREWVDAHLPRPHKTDHKGTKGTLGILAGSHRYRGAAVLCTSAALRAGVGLVKLISTSGVCNAVAAALPCAILLPVGQGVAGGIGIDGATLALEGGPTALLAGCGMGLHAETALHVTRLMQSAPCPLLLDADALNALAGLATKGDTVAARTRMLALLEERGAPTVLTPHIGEMARLCGLPAAEVSQNQAEAAADFARRYGCVVVLKNNVTTVAGPAGALYQNDGAGNPGLATGGSGDVLAGILAGLLAQGMEAAEAAACAVWLHAATADLVAETTGFAGLSPADLPAALPRLLHSMNR